MKKPLLFLAFIALVLLGCTPKEKLTEPTNYSIMGFVQKGPFIQGSTITIQALDPQKLSPTGQTFSTITNDDLGSFSLESEIPTRYVEVTANGYYYNEVLGSYSRAPISLRAISDLAEEGYSNINILTTLEADLVKKRVRNGDSIKEARTYAEELILSGFGIPYDAEQSFGKMDISGEKDADAILLAISVIIQSIRSEAEFVEYYSKLAKQLVESEFIDINPWEYLSNIDVDTIRKNLLDRYGSVPPFERYLDMDGDGNLDGDKLIVTPPSRTLDYREQYTKMNVRATTKFKVTIPDTTAWIVAQFPTDEFINSNGPLSLLVLENKTALIRKGKVVVTDGARDYYMEITQKPAVYENGVVITPENYKDENLYLNYKTIALEGSFTLDEINYINYQITNSRNDSLKVLDYSKVESALGGDNYQSVRRAPGLKKIILPENAEVLYGNLISGTCVLDSVIFGPKLRTIMGGEFLGGCWQPEVFEFPATVKELIGAVFPQSEKVKEIRIRPGTYWEAPTWSMIRAERFIIGNDCVCKNKQLEARYDLPLIHPIRLRTVVIGDGSTISGPFYSRTNEELPALDTLIIGNNVTFNKSSFYGLQDTHLEIGYGFAENLINGGYTDYPFFNCNFSSLSLKANSNNEVVLPEKLLNQGIINRLVLPANLSKISVLWKSGPSSESMGTFAGCLFKDARIDIRPSSGLDCDIEAFRHAIGVTFVCDNQTSLDIGENNRIEYYVNESVVNLNIGKLVKVVLGNNVNRIRRIASPNLRVVEGIDSRIITIYESAFYDCSSLESFDWPSSVTSIPNNCFFGCSSLQTFNISGGLSSIGSNAFSGCSSLQTFNISGGLSSIGSNAFSGCSSLQTFNVNGDVTSIGRYAFSGCMNLRSFEINGQISSIGEGAFSSCTLLTSFKWPSLITSVPEYCFNNCASLSSIMLPSSVTTVAAKAFSGCAFSSLDFMNNVKTLDISAIDGIKIDPVVIPSKVDSLYGFYSGPSENLVIPGSCKMIKINRCSFKRIAVQEGVKKLAYLAGDLIEELHLPSTITNIGTLQAPYLIDLSIDAIVPPTVNVITLEKYVVIHIPAGTKSAYESSPVWSAYASNFVEN